MQMLKLRCFREFRGKNNSVSRDFDLPLASLGDVAGFYTNLAEGPHIVTSANVTCSVQLLITSVARSCYIDHDAEGTLHHRRLR